MTPEKALVRHTGPYMLAAKAQALIDAEVAKGCDGNVLANPVALEPVFNPITMPKDILALREDRPGWILEAPPDQQDLLRHQVWLSPEQPFDWDSLELFIKQLSLVSNRVGLEITGNRDKIIITLLCHHSDEPSVVTSFLGKLKFCRLPCLDIL